MNTLLDSTISKETWDEYWAAVLAAVEGKPAHNLGGKMAIAGVTREEYARHVRLLCDRRHAAEQLQLAQQKTDTRGALKAEVDLREAHAKQVMAEAEKQINEAKAAWMQSRDALSALERELDTLRPAEVVLMRQMDRDLDLRGLSGALNTLLEEHKRTTEAMDKLLRLQSEAELRAAIASLQYELKETKNRGDGAKRIEQELGELKSRLAKLEASRQQIADLEPRIEEARRKVQERKAWHRDWKNVIVSRPQTAEPHQL